MSHFFAYLARMRFIRRWGLMHNTYPENIQEHSLRVAMIGHALAVIRNQQFAGQVNAERVAVLALYHDAGEVMTGDMPSPVKYFNPEIREAYGEIEAQAAKRLLAMIPKQLLPEYQPLFQPQDADNELWELVKAADKLCAYIKCLEEKGAGNPEFNSAERGLAEAVKRLALPEVDYFVETFLASFELDLDQLSR